MVSYLLKLLIRIRGNRWNAKGYMKDRHDIQQGGVDALPKIQGNLNVVRALACCSTLIIMCKRSASTS